MNAEHINPFISVACDMLKQVCNISATRGQLYIKKSTFSADRVVILVGLAGQLKGQVFLSMDEKVACQIASAMMCGMPVPQLDDMSKSAISELGNMILGNVATTFANNGITMDITTPTLMVGNDILISTKANQTVCIPLEFDGGKLEIDVAIED